LLAMKTAAAAADATIQIFITTREILTNVKGQYIETLRKGKFTGLDEKQWTDLFGEVAMTEEEVQSLADEMFGDPAQINEARLVAGSSDHCNGAQASLRGVAKKADESCKKFYGDKWELMSETEQAVATMLFLYGCQHHLRNICFGRGHKVVEETLRELLEEDLQKLKEKGIHCLNGKVTFPSIPSRPPLPHSLLLSLLLLSLLLSLPLSPPSFPPSLLQSNRPPRTPVTYRST